MKFYTDISELKQNQNVDIKVDGAKIPSHKDVFFRAKQNEIFEQYESARIFLRETETRDWNHWFQDANPKYQEVFELLFINRMFEVALMYYNIIVDLSWTLCYVSVEYAVYEKDKKPINMSNLMNIEAAYNALRKAENFVTNPDSNGNPMEYLKTRCPEFKDSIDLIINFWKEFSNSNIRNLYNFIKHKGKPLYEEVEKFRDGGFISLIIKNESYPTDIRDVQRVINLKDSIKELKEFDDKVLFPYIKKLLKLLEIAVDPSPFVF